MTAVAPLISVVIPCYDQARFLGDAIESVLGQDGVRVDTIVVDDGSTDDTAAVAASYAGVRCRRQRNAGLSRARNVGLAWSRGSHVVFLDADDRLLPGALAAGARTLAKHPECGFVFGHHRRIGQRGERLRTPVEPCGTTDAYEALLRMNYISMPGKVMFRRETLRAVGGFDPENGAAGDYDLYLRITRRFPIRCHHVEVAEYRQHDGNMTRDAALMLRATRAALAGQRPWVRAHPRYRAAYAEGLEFARAYYASRLVEDVERRVASRQWARALAALLVLARRCPDRMIGAAARRCSRPLLGLWRPASS